MAIQKPCCSPAQYSVNAKYFTASQDGAEIREKTKLIIPVRFGDFKENITVAFPKQGGIRIFGSSVGIFRQDDFLPIDYVAEDKIKVQNIAVIIKKHNDKFNLSIYNNDELKIRIDSDRLSYGFEDGKLAAVKFISEIKDSEQFFGLGERFNGLYQHDDISMWNSDGYYGGNDNEKKNLSYANVPVIHSTNGYTFFFNSTYCGIVDVGFTDKTQLSMDMWGPIFDIYMWVREPLENIRSYTELTGLPWIPPKWAFEYWAGGGAIVWEMNGESIVPEIVRGWITEYKKMNAKPSALFGEGLPSFNKECYDYLNENDVKMLMWNYSGKNFKEMAKLMPDIPKKDWPVIKYYPDSDEFYEDYTDFTHPNAGLYIERCYQKYWDWGLHGIMVDFGEFVAENTVMYNGKTGREAHNLHALYYAKGHHDAWTKRMGSDYVLFSRAGCAGSQKYAPNFTGDQTSDFNGLKEQVSAVLSGAASGFEIMGGDIGGFFRQPGFEVWGRWIEFAAFTPLMRAHGCPTGRNPWEWGNNGRDIFKAHYFLRQNLLDRIYSAALQSGKDGTPMVKSFPVAYHGNKEMEKADTQFTFCDTVLVAPIFETEVKEKAVRFPKGSWYNVWNGNRIEGNDNEIVVDAHFERAVAYFKSGIITPAKIGNSLRLAEEVGQGSSNAALLITPPDNDTVYRHLTEEGECEYKLVLNADGYSAICEREQDVPVILIFGQNIGRLFVDGAELWKTDADDKDAEGFFFDGNNTAVRLKRSFKEITVYNAK